MKRTYKDSQLKEFEKNDLGEDINKSQSSIIVRRKSKPTSIALSESLITKLKIKAKKKGIVYQTLLKIILNECVDQY